MISIEGAEQREKEENHDLEVVFLSFLLCDIGSGGGERKRWAATYKSRLRASNCWRGSALCAANVSRRLTGSRDVPGILTMML